MILRDSESNEAIASVSDARRQDVDLVLTQDPGTDDGRSDWCWIRMANGDLFLAVAPRGATYERLEGAPGTDWSWAEGEENA